MSARQRMGITFVVGMSACLFVNAELSLAADSGKEAATQVVVVSGVGKDEETAKRQAYRNAIRQVVGALVLTETIVNNEDVLQDRILAHSDGYVTKAEQIGTVRAIDGGLLEISVRVTVAKGKLMEGLDAENIVRTVVDGQNLFAEVITKQDKMASQLDIISEALKNMPAAVLRAKAGKPKIDPEKPGEVVIPVVISVDPIAYSKFSRNFSGVLEKMGLSGEVFALESEGSLYSNLQLSRDYYQWKERHMEAPMEIMICEVIDEKSKRGRVRVFPGSKEVGIHMAKIKPKVWCSVKILDTNDEEIAKSDFVLEWYGYRRVITPVWANHTDALAIFAPATQLRIETGNFNFPDEKYKNCLLEGYTKSEEVFDPTFTLYANIVMSEAEIKKAKSITCSMRNSAPTKE